MESRKSLGERRQHLVRAAEQLFCKRGYDTTNIQDITEQAKFHPAVFHRCFHDKAEVYDQLLAKRVAGIWDKMMSTTEKPATPSQVLVGIIHAWFQGMDDDEFLSTPEAHPIGLGERNHALPFLNALSHFANLIESQFPSDPDVRARLQTAISRVSDWFLGQTQLALWFDRDAVIEALAGVVY